MSNQLDYVQLLASLLQAGVPFQQLMNAAAPVAGAQPTSPGMFFPGFPAPGALPFVPGAMPFVPMPAAAYAAMPALMRRTSAFQSLPTVLPTAQAIPWDLYSAVAASGPLAELASAAPDASAPAPASAAPKAPQAAAQAGSSGTRTRAAALRGRPRGKAGAQTSTAFELDEGSSGNQGSPEVDDDDDDETFSGDSADKHPRRKRRATGPPRGAGSGRKLKQSRALGQASYVHGAGAGESSGAAAVTAGAAPRTGRSTGMLELPGGLALPNEVDYRWSAEEDEALRLWVARHGSRHWRRCGQAIGRSGNACALRWLRVLDPSNWGAPWSEEEDAILRDFQASGSLSWHALSEQLPGRTALNLRCRAKELERRALLASMASAAGSCISAASAADAAASEALSALAAGLPAPGASAQQRNASQQAESDGDAAVQRSSDEGSPGAGAEASANSGSSVVGAAGACAVTQGGSAGGGGSGSVGPADSGAGGGSGGDADGASVRARIGGASGAGGGGSGAAAGGPRSQVSGSSSSSRATTVAPAGRPRGPSNTMWLADEDRQLRDWVAANGPRGWVDCALQLKGRTHDQCRLRWARLAAQPAAAQQHQR